MKNHVLNIMLAAGVILLGACGNDDNPAEPVRASAPSMRATIGEFTEANPQPETRAGVVEDNSDYKNGEQFYWVDGDQAKVLFFKDGNLDSEPVTVIYTARVAEGAKPGYCSFTPEAGASIPDGNYTVYGLYPAAEWTKDENGYRVGFEYGSTIFYQPDYTSRHLGKYMYMKAKTTVTVSGQNAGEISLAFKHLSAIVRLRITDNSTWARPLVFSSVSLSTRDYSGLYPREAHLASLEDGRLTPVESSRVFVSQVSGGTMTEWGLEFADMPYGYGIELFFPVIPCSIPDPATTMGFNGNIRSSEPTTHVTSFGYQNGLTFNNQLAFLKNGFEAGKSYYFDLFTVSH